VEVILRLTGGIGVDRAIDAVGVDAMHAHHGPAARTARQDKAELKRELKEVAPRTKPEGDNWVPGDAPAQAVMWAVEALAKAGTLSIIGVYPQRMRTFPIGQAMNKNLTLNMGNCNHRKYIPHLLELVRTGAVEPTELLTHVQPLTSAIEAYRSFDMRKPGWLKVELEPPMLT
jgi:threonine dehydrogenase-like Zn-dependent dehydrogenase